MYLFWHGQPFVGRNRIIDTRNISKTISVFLYSLLFSLLFFLHRIYFFLVCFFGRTVFARASCSCFDKKKIFKLLTGVYVWTWLCCYFIQDETELVCDCVRIASQTYIRFGLFFFSFSFEKGTTQRKKLKESRNQKNIWHSHETYMSEN